MGNTDSSQNITQVNNQLFVTKNTVKSLSEQINSQVSNTIIKDAKSCTASINNNQAITIKKINVKGDFVFNSKQSQVAALTFSCVQSTNVRNTAGSEIISSMVSDLTSKTSNEALSALDAKAKQEAKTGFGSTGDVKQDQNLTQISNFESNTENHKEIENIVKNIVENNFSAESVSNCIAQVNNSQNLNIEEVNVEGKAVIAVDQTQAATVVANCIQESDIGNGIINAAAAAFDVKVKDEVSSKSTQAAKADATQKVEQQGVLDGLAKLAGSIFGPLLALMALPWLIGGFIICVIFCGVLSFCCTGSKESKELVAGVAQSAMIASQMGQQMGYPMGQQMGQQMGYPQHGYYG